MLETCALGIAFIGGECTATWALGSADVIAPNITQALHLFTKPLRLLATLRH